MFKFFYFLIFLIIFFSKNSQAISSRLIISEGGGIMGFLNAFISLIILYVIGYISLYIINLIRIKNNRNCEINTKELTDKSIDRYIEITMGLFFIFIPLSSIVIIIFLALLSLVLSILITGYHYGDLLLIFIQLYFILATLGSIIYGLIKAVKGSSID